MRALLSSLVNHKIHLVAATISVGITVKVLHQDTIESIKALQPTHWLPPSRQELISNLKATEFDVLIIGGGATGTGCALDSALRGLKTAMVERDDFSAGTSSRSTKLIHGGVRYLEKAFLELDYEQYKLVREALHERGSFMKIAPYLAHEVPIMLPLTVWWKIPYYWVGSKVYDILAGSMGLSSSYFLCKDRAVEAFPMLQRDKISGAIVYYDGAHNDSRMNVAIALTAIQYGAVVANHIEVVELLKKPREQNIGKEGFGDKEICGAVCRDVISGELFHVKAKGVINATGPFCDGIRKLDSGIETKEIVAPSSGVHVVLPSYFSPKNMGLIDPNTSDGRVIFFLPWEGSVIAGTTDSPTKVEANPVPGDDDINWILKELRRGDVQAAWSGIRPLVRDPNAKNTESLVRNHMIHVSTSGLLTIAGGKWTTYRIMAEETLDKAIQVFNLSAKSPCTTKDVLLLGSHHWSPNLFIKLVQHFGLEIDVATHLADSYGDRAWGVAALASQTGSRWPIYGTRIAMGYPYIEAEVRYACQHEYACTVVDVIARRTRLGFLNAKAALESLPRVIEIMSSELNWSVERRKSEYENARYFLSSMGLSIKEEIQFPDDGKSQIGSECQARNYSKTHFLPVEIAKYKATFKALDFDNDGSISQKDFEKALYKLGVKLNAKELKEAIDDVDLDQSGTIEFNEFLEVLAAVKDIRGRSKFAKIVAEYQDREPVSSERSGGGV